MTHDAEQFLLIGAGLFVLGTIGFITRRNLIVMILSAEMMLHGVSLTLVTFGHMHRNFEGQAFTIFSLTIAACEAGLALSLVLALYRQSHSLDIRNWTGLRDPDTTPVSASAAEADRNFEMDSEPGPLRVEPRLTPAGSVPAASRCPASFS
ncbi:MAG: NADH-quinone oxidoreductase subunit NuoK [Planctomycetaceae bacterium]